VLLESPAVQTSPAEQAEWAATQAAAEALDAELPYPLGGPVVALRDASARRTFRARIADAAGTLDDATVGPFRGSPARPGSAG
jgi:hypothetical protein